MAEIRVIKLIYVHMLSPRKICNNVHSCYLTVWELFRTQDVAIETRTSMESMEYGRRYALRCENSEMVH